MEIVIKQAVGKLTLSGGAHQFVAELVEDGVRTLDASVEHMLRMGTLPPRHRDPFDRLLVAQALVEGLTLVSADAQVLAYDAQTLDARTQAAQSRSGSGASQCGGGRFADPRHSRGHAHKFVGTVIRLPERPAQEEAR